MKLTSHSLECKRLIRGVADDPDRKKGESALAGVARSLKRKFPDKIARHFLRGKSRRVEARLARE